MSAPATLPRLWSVEKLARHWDAKPDSIRAMWRRGTLPGIKIGRKLYFDEAALIAFLEKRRPA